MQTKIRPTSAHLSNAEMNNPIRTLQIVSFAMIMIIFLFSGITFLDQLVPEMRNPTTNLFGHANSQGGDYGA